jgi:hypothetical protein
MNNNELSLMKESALDLKLLGLDVNPIRVFALAQGGTRIYYKFPKGSNHWTQQKAMNELRLKPLFYSLEDRYVWLLPCDVVDLKDKPFADCSVDYLRCEK